MKKNILSITIAIIALFSVSAAVAQSPHVVKKGSHTDPIGKHVCFTGDIAGLGSLAAAATADFQLFAEVTYTVTCVNNGTNTAVGQSGQRSTLESPVTAYPIDQNGRANIQSLCTQDATGTCKGNGLTPNVSNLQVKSAYLLVNGGQYKIPL